MADELLARSTTSADGAGNAVNVDTQALRNFATWITNEAVKAQPHLTALEMLSVYPGAFPHAESFQSKVHTHRNGLLQNIANLRGAYRTIAEDLGAVIAAYDKGEGNAEEQASALNALMTDLNMYVPGASGGASGGGIGTGIGGGTGGGKTAGDLPEVE